MAQTPYVSLAEFKSLMGVTDNVDNTAITLALDHATDYINRATGRRFDLQAGIQRVLSGSGTSRLFLGDFTALTEVRMAQSTGGTQVVQAAGTYFPGPVVPDREDDEPYRWIDLTVAGSSGAGHDWVSSPLRSWLGPVWYEAFQNITVTGSFGWAEVPADIKTACLDLAQRYRMSMRAGFSDIIGTAEDGTPIWSKALSPMTRDTLGRLKLRSVVMA